MEVGTAAPSTRIAADTIANFIYSTEAGAGIEGWSANPATGVPTARRRALRGGQSDGPSRDNAQWQLCSTSSTSTGTVANVVTPNSISAYAINPTTGALVPVNGSSFVTGNAVPASVAVAPNGQFAYAVNAGANGAASISQYGVNGSTCAHAGGKPACDS